jgi:MFS family permease
MAMKTDAPLLSSLPTTSLPPLTGLRRSFVLVGALLAWLCAGLVMAVPPLATRAAVASMGVTEEALRGRWFSWYVCAFLLGAAAGGFGFGWLGDRIGRAKALGLSVLTYSLVTGACYFSTSPERMLVLWTIACTGVGGVWPNGVALASEALPGASRPWISGLFGTTANLGLVLLSVLAFLNPITVDDWRWVMLVTAAPAPLGLFILAFVPESPAWLAGRRQAAAKPSSRRRLGEVFRPPLLSYTIIGILLGTIPLMGNWGASNWLVPWANQAQEAGGDAGLSAATQWTKSGGAAIGSLLGGWFASRCGRRTAYFLISLFSLVSSFYIFHSLSPLDGSFLTWVFIQGFVGTVYFGWLPLYLPELFPTRVRATGAGVTFNWGRVVTAAGVLMGGQLMLAFGGDYARVGQITCLVYALGMIVICFAPDTTGKRLDEVGGKEVA